VAQALALSDELASPGGDLRRTPDVGQADVIVVNGVRPAPEVAAQIRARVEAGQAGLLLLMGPELDAGALAELGLAAMEVRRADDARSLQPAAPTAGVTASLLNEIAWNSAPQVRARSVVSGGNIEPLVTLEGSGEVFLGYVPGASHPVILVTGWLSDPSNRPFREWPYFNYWLYSMAVTAAGGQPQSFAAYPASPVPHERGQLAVLAIVALTVAATAGAFFLARRYSRRHPEALASLVADEKQFARTAESGDWSVVGFHRPLSGFLLLFMANLILAIPNLVHQNIVIYGWLVPSAQARGNFALVTGFFTVIWSVFDWGTGTAMPYFFGRLRVKEPGRAYQYAQFFVWWQTLTGALQFGAIALLCAFIAPHTRQAFLSWLVIVYALIQWPGFLQMFWFIFRAQQRNDYEQIQMMLQGFGPIIFQTIPVWALGVWGASQPAFGRTWGATLGLAAGVYLTYIGMFVVGAWLYRRLGLKTSVLFMAHFDRDVVISSLKYGFPVMLTAVATTLGFASQALFTARLLLNYTEVQGNWAAVGPTQGGMMLRFLGISILGISMVPTMAEAFAHRRLELYRHYLAQGLRWVVLFSATILATYLAAGGWAILGMLGPEYQRAAEMLIPLSFWGFFVPISMLLDRGLEAAGRPGLATIANLAEQLLRIGLMLALMPRLQVAGLILAYVLALPVKLALTWWLVNRHAVRIRLSWWQTLVAPALSVVPVYAILRGLVVLVGAPTAVGGVLVIVVGMLLALPLLFFTTGVVGGWDDDTLAEFRRSVALVPAARPGVGPLLWATAAGCRLSPLHGRFRSDLAGLAAAEAESLTKERVSLREIRSSGVVVL
jgi:O-antigen/teichoic acid export membrane protein